jgi:hypothetical protein
MVGQKLVRLIRSNISWISSIVNSIKSRLLSFIFLKKIWWCMAGCNNDLALKPKLVGSLKIKPFRFK